jgi:hypothetical protein
MLVLAVLGLAGCGSARQVPEVDRAAPPAKLASGSPPHVAVIVMENEEYGDLLAAPHIPYIRHLVASGALAGQMYAIAHPSLPNYLALATGSTHGITDDCTDCSVPGSGLAGQLSAHRISWRAYMEGMPRPCFTGAGAGQYAKKHNPFIYADAVRTSAADCARIVPFSALARDEQARTLPRFIWVTPNLCHDMHDCDPGTGDRFLAATVPALLAAMGPRSLLVLTWDEGSSDNGCCRLAHGGHVLTVLAGPAARHRARLATATDHYSTLQLIEDLFALPRAGGAACACTPSLAPLLAGPAPRPAARHRS